MGSKKYQRPYLDIGSHRDKSAYRLGSVVFHLREEGEVKWLDIVDGQQRTLTLAISN